MSCKEIKKLIYVKEDELTEAERRVLQNHIAECAACRLEREAFSYELIVVDSLKQQPVLDDPDLLTNEIMRSIRNMEKFSRQQKHPFDTLLDVFSRRTVRFVMATSIILIIGFFFVQEMAVLNRLDHLEQRLAQHGSASTALVEAKNALSLIGKSNEQVMIDKELLDEFFKSYGELQMKNRLLLQALQEQAEQSNITWQDGLTEKELESLLESETIRQKLREL